MTASCVPLPVSKMKRQPSYVESKDILIRAPSYSWLILEMQTVLHIYASKGLETFTLPSLTSERKSFLHSGFRRKSYQVSQTNRLRIRWSSCSRTVGTSHSEGGIYDIFSSSDSLTFPGSKTQCGSSRCDTRIIRVVYEGYATVSILQPSEDVSQLSLES